VSIDRRGTFVRSVSDDDIEEIFSLWDLLWPFALQRAAVRVGPEERQWLVDFGAREVPTDLDGILEYAIEFGRAVFRMAHHQRALEIFETLLIQVQARSLFVIANAQSGRGTTWNPDYSSLCEMLARGDAAAAAALADERIASTRSFWFSRLQNVVDGDPAVANVT
jgi:DNA-binding GntR family transcriptional regulator